MNILSPTGAGASELEMTRSCARDLTDRINSSSEDLAGMLKRAHDEKAWQALGYSDWKTYVREEIKFSKQHAFRLLDLANISKEIAESPKGDSLPPPTERAARELKKVEPDKRPEVYAKAVESAGGKQPTAKQVEAAVVEVHTPETKPARLPKLAVGSIIAFNAIRLLKAIPQRDPKRHEAGIEVVEWVKANLLHDLVVEALK